MMVFLPRRYLSGRYLQPALSAICFLLLLQLSLMAWGAAANKTIATPPVATGTINHPVSLSPYLVPITSPSDSLLQTESEPERYLWYQLNLVLSPDFSTDWLLVFSRIPHPVLDIYLPENKLSTNELSLNRQYQIKRMGVDSLSASNPDVRTIRLPLTSGQTHKLLIKVSKQSSRNLAPELWPASLYSLSEYRYHALSASLQTIMLAMLGAVLATALIKKTYLYLPLGAHLSAISLLLVALNGSLFRLIPYNIDPGQLVSTVTVLTMLSALACYLNLFRVTRLTPKTIMTLSGATLVASGLMFGFVFAVDNTVPSLPLVLLLCLQSISLTLLHYLLQPGQKKQPFTVNLIKGAESKRRVFSQHFRESLLQLNQQDDNNELTEHILDIIDGTLHKTPAVLLQYENNEWQLSSHSTKAKQQIDRELEHFVSPLTQLPDHDSDDQIHFQDKQGNSFWGFHLNDDAERQLFLVLFPGKYQRETITRQQAA
ncbi:7TM-DISM domain-containing protein [Endozoicomonas lisbonensis]|uniref:7TM-DISM domain-containing protein n=1 Tax=Endozoicomonas lisbonensis TaxID=3120522 RepID=UPI003390EABF